MNNVFNYFKSFQTKGKDSNHPNQEIITDSNYQQNIFEKDTMNHINENQDENIYINYGQKDSVILSNNMQNQNDQTFKSPKQNFFNIDDIGLPQSQMKFLKDNMNIFSPKNQISETKTQVNGQDQENSDTQQQEKNDIQQSQNLQINQQIQISQQQLIDETKSENIQNSQNNDNIEKEEINDLQDSNVISQIIEKSKEQSFSIQQHNNDEFFNQENQKSQSQKFDETIIKEIQDSQNTDLLKNEEKQIQQNIILDQLNEIVSNESNSNASKSTKKHMSPIQYHDQIINLDDKNDFLNVSESNLMNLDLQKALDQQFTQEQIQISNIPNLQSNHKHSNQQISEEIESKSTQAQIQQSNIIIDLKVKQENLEQNHSYLETRQENLETRIQNAEQKNLTLEQRILNLEKDYKKQLFKDRLGKIGENNNTLSNIVKIDKKKMKPLKQNEPIQKPKLNLKNNYASGWKK